MIEYNRDDHSMEMICDSCDDGSSFYGDFTECIIEAKEEGWLIYKLDGDYTHRCPACVEYENSAEHDFKEV